MPSIDLLLWRCHDHALKSARVSARRQRSGANKLQMIWPSPVLRAPHSRGSSPPSNHVLQALLEAPRARFVHDTTAFTPRQTGWTTLAFGSMINDHAALFGRRQSKGTMAGACLGLFVLALVDRWSAAKDENGKGGRSGGMCLHAPTFVPADDVMRGALHALQAVLGFAFMLAVMCVLAFSSSSFWLTASSALLLFLRACPLALRLFRSTRTDTTEPPAFILALVYGLDLDEVLFGKYAAAVSYAAASSRGGVSVHRGTL
ncbi:hypothetical protein FB451DRAFT_1396600 [Mycena latifolia]|nr:hypothetical protein FB451DRAFT_1396600 [Mycena latifolia]